MKENIYSGSIEEILIILTKYTIDKFLKEERPSDLIGLYIFYYYTAKWQKTNQPKCTDGYVRKGLNWNKDRFYKAKKILKEFGLIEQVNRKNKEGKIEGWYIKVNYIFKQETITNITSPVSSLPESGIMDINTLSINNLNTLSNDNIEESKKLSSENNSLLEKIKTNLPIEKRNLIFPQEYKDLISIWNNFPRIASKHKDLSTKTIKNAYKYYRFLKNGSFVKNTCIEDSTLKKFRIPLSARGKKFTDTEIIRGFKNLMLEYEDGYFPFELEEKKRILPKSIEKAFYSKYGCPSVFLKCFYCKPEYIEERVKIIDNPHPEETEKIKMEFFDVYMEITEENKLIKVVKNLYNYTRKLCNEKIMLTDTDFFTRQFLEEKINGSHFERKVVNFKGFIDYLIIFYNEKKENWPEFKVNMSCFKTEGKLWNDFCNWMKEEYVDIRLDRSLKLLLREYEAELKKSGKIKIIEKSIEEQIEDLNRSIKDSTPGSANYEIFMQEREKLFQKKGVEHNNKDRKTF